MCQLLPTPKSITPAEGEHRLRGPVCVAAVSEAAARPARWLGEQLHAHSALTCVRTEPKAAAIVLGMLDELQTLGLAPPDWSASPAFATAEGREQGYVLVVTPQRIVLAAHGEAGLRNAAATVVQLVAPDGSVPCALVEDWPDFRFRVADWLINVEINRWGYERGDGRDALFARMCRKLDLAARHKLNVVWFDGFGWNPDRRAGYAEFARALARRARELGIRLAHAGYGGGYGFAYQASDIYSAPYMGRVFENRRPWPNGELYPCLGHPLYERSWTWGTCLSNDELLAAKLDELTAFVRACEPGLLYIHDLDTGDRQLAAIAWARRCDQCRRRWPNDEVTAPDGMAGAYARWFRMLTDAVSAIRSDDGEYHAARDCELVFVGPIYTDANDSPEVWAQEVAYFQLLSELIGPAQNIQFGIREQGVTGSPVRPRVAELVERLDMVGNGHGVLVINFSGGDAYYNDQLISPAAALSPLFRGARTFYTVHLGSVAEPAQLIAAELGWNTAAPSAFTIPSTQEETHELMRQLRLGSLRPDAVFGTGGLLQRACALLYGPCAGPLVARALASDEWGGSPVATICRSVPRAIQRLLANKDWDGSDILEGWRARADASRQAADLVAQALDCRDLPPGAAEDLRWLHGCLQVGAQFAEALVVAHLLAARRRAEFADRLSALCAELRRQVQEDFPTDIFDPVGGEMALWLVAIDELEELADAYRSRGWV